MSSDRAGGEPNPGERTAAPGGEQLALIRETVRRRRPRPRAAQQLAKRLPVARVAVDKALSHLDQYFDYAVPARLDATAVPGVRVRVRFGGRVGQGGRRSGGRLVDGFLVERRAESDFPGALAPLNSVVSPEPVLSPALLALARGVAARYAGTLADVLQLAVPPRHGRAEAEPVRPPLPPPAAPEPGSWVRYREGPGYLRALASGGIPRAVWTALPGPWWPEEVARAMVAALASGRGALAVLPDGRAAARVDAALTTLLGPGRHVLLTADAGPEERYRRWLAARRGTVRAVVGTRAAMFAPVRDLGLAVIWDDADSSHQDQQAPQPHAREVLLQRAVTEHAGLLLGGHTRTVEAAQLVETGWARPLAADREAVRAAAPLVRTVDEHEEARDPAARSARLPTLAWRTARDALRHGPVLVQVPRRGYVPRLACGRCREPARCPHCSGPLQATTREAVGCGWCGREAPDWHCPHCGGVRLRASVVGVLRTAEELGRAFPGVPVVTSGRDQVRDTVPDRPALVVSTPGAEPVAVGGYAAALLLDGWALLNRPDLRAGEEALRRWLGAAALVRGQERTTGGRPGGVVVVLAEPTLPPVQALVRWDPSGFARRELAERAQLGFPPVSRMASISGPPEAVASFLATAELPPEAEVLGPVPLPVSEPGRPRRSGAPPAGEQWERALVRVPTGSGAALAAALKAARAARLARREGPAVWVRIDPPDIG